MMQCMAKDYEKEMIIEKREQMRKRTPNENTTLTTNCPAMHNLLCEMNAADTSRPFYQVHFFRPVGLRPNCWSICHNWCPSVPHSITGTVTHATSLIKSRLNSLYRYIAVRVLLR